MSLERKGRKKRKEEEEEDEIEGNKLSVNFVRPFQWISNSNQVIE